MRLFARKKGLPLSGHGLTRVIRVKNKLETVVAFTKAEVFQALKRVKKEIFDYLKCTNRLSEKMRN